MGIPWDEEDFGNDCFCWPPGLTPKHVYVSFTDIIVCPIAPAAPGGPNSTFKLTQDGACVFRSNDPDWKITYTLGIGISRLWCENIASGIMAFKEDIFANCRQAFVSSFVCHPFLPFPVWAGGSAFVSFPGEGQ